MAYTAECEFCGAGIYVSFVTYESHGFHQVEECGDCPNPLCPGEIRKCDECYEDLPWDHQGDICAECVEWLANEEAA